MSCTGVRLLENTQLSGYGIMYGFRCTNAASALIGKLAVSPNLIVRHSEYSSDVH